MIIAACLSLVLNACGGGDGTPIDNGAPTPVAPLSATDALATAAQAQATGNLATVTTVASIAAPLEPPASAPTSGTAPLAAVINAETSNGLSLAVPIGAAAPSVELPAAAPAGGVVEVAVESAPTAVIGAANPISTVGSEVVQGTASAPAPANSTPASGYLRTVYVDAAAGSPGDGTAGSPYRSIGAAMRNLRAGDDIVIAGGIYREWVVVPPQPGETAATRIRAAASRSVLVKGSDEVTGWVAASPGTYTVDWQGEEPQQVFRGGALLRQIGGTVFSGYPLTPTADLAGLHASEGGIWPARVTGGVSALVPDSFTYDAARRQLVVRLSAPLSPRESLEVSSRPHVLQAEQASKLSIEGIDFAHSNTSRDRRWGAIKVVGRLNTLRNLMVRDMDATCVQVIGDDNVVLDSTIERCGQTGISGHGRRLTIANNQILSNNTRGFNKWWEAGGIKLIGDTGLHDSVIRNNVVAYNAGDGIWLDTRNTQILIEGNTTAYNAGFGIHYEASQSAIIRDNRAYGNAMRGIYLFESSSTLIEKNAVFGNAMEGIGVVDGGRSAADPSLKPYDNRVRNNTMAWNDFDRNWVQLVVPGDSFRTSSDNNAFKAERLAPRMSMGFMSLSNPAFERLDLWQSAKRLDLASNSQTVPMPTVLRTALAARRLLTTEQLPTTLKVPGTY